MVWKMLQICRYPQQVFISNENANFKTCFQQFINLLCLWMTSTFKKTGCIRSIKTTITMDQDLQKSPPKLTRKTKFPRFLIDSRNTPAANKKRKSRPYCNDKQPSTKHKTVSFIIGVCYFNFPSSLRWQNALQVYGKERILH